MTLESIEAALAALPPKGDSNVPIQVLAHPGGTGEDELHLWQKNPESLYYYTAPSRLLEANLMKRKDLFKLFQNRGVVL